MPSPQGNHTKAAQARHNAGLARLHSEAIPNVCYSYSAIARAMGVDPWAVKLIERRALRKMRVRLIELNRELGLRLPFIPSPAHRRV